jgi:tetratricopeptide (TPR) repeat protein
MLSRSATFISSISNYIVLATMVLGLLFVLPITDDFINQSKLFVFFLSTIALGIGFVVYSIQKKTIELVLSPITIPLLVFGLAMAASTFFTSNYPIEALMRFGGAFLLLVSFVIFASTTTTRKLADLLLPVAGVTAGIVTLFSITQIFKFGPATAFNAIFGLQLPTDLSFNVAVNSLFALQFLVIVLVGMIAESVIKKHISRITAIIFPIILVGIAVLGWSLLPGRPGSQVAPSWAASWSVALDTIRAPRAALIGGGPASYTNLYTRFKPVWINGTDKWNYSFTQANNLPLTLLSTTGFLGLITWLLVVFQVFRLTRFAKEEQSKVLGYMLLASIVFQLILPTHLVILLVQTVLLVALVASMHGSLPVMRFQALTMSMDTQDQAFHTPSRKVSFPIYFTGGAILLLLAFVGYFGGRYYAASIAFFNSAKAAEKQEIVQAYEQQQRAVQLNPYYDFYRRQYAMTNMAIASALAQKADITQAEKDQVGVLIQQAVREARSAVTLDPLDVQNTTVLAQIYQNLIGATEQADQFAIQGYLAAIDNDPTNPDLRLALGGLLSNQKQYTQAANIFNEAVALKRDYPSSIYNLAITLVQLNDLENAKAAYQALIPLLNNRPPEELKQVQDELAEVEKKIAALPKDEKKAQGGQTGTQSDGQNTNQQQQRTTTPSLLDPDLNTNDVTAPSDADISPAAKATPAPTATPTTTETPTP